jgi:hypothetical protein
VKKRSEDVEKALDEAVSEQLRTGEWRKFPHYQRRELDNGDAYFFAPPWRLDESDPEMLKLYEGVKQSLEREGIHDAESASETAARHAGIWQENEPQPYKPLVDEPDLFLKFAGVIEGGPITESVMLEWVRSYGVLGLDKSAGVAGMGSYRGGPSENVFSFGERAAEANVILRLYEAARSPYGPHKEMIKKHMLMPEVPHQRSWLARPKVREKITEESDREADVLEQSSLAKPSIQRILGERLQEDAVEQRSQSNLGQMALDAVKQIVSERLAEECSQGLYLQEDGTDRQGWRFKSLLGAMYLQMASLISYTGKMRVCRAPGCFRIISLEKPEPYMDPRSGKMVSPRKPRSDKILCGRYACQKRYERSNEQTQ